MDSATLELPQRPFQNARAAQIGDTHTWTRKFGEEDILHTGTATHDRNPVHFDAEYAARTRFKRPILHGVATLGEISRALGMDFPGRGTIFLELTARFKRPIYPGDTVHFNAEIVEVNPERERLTIRVTAQVDGVIVLEAQSVVFLEDDPELPN